MEVTKNSRLEERNRTFQKGVDLDEVRRRREEGVVELRKKNRNQQVAKKRAVLTAEGKTAGEAINNFKESVTIEHSWISVELKDYAPQISDQSIAPESRLDTLLDVICTCSDLTVLVKALEVLRKVLSVDLSPPFSQVMKSDVIKRIIEMLDVEELQLEASWCAINLASGPTQVTDMLCAHGIIGKLVGNLNSQIPELVDQSVWTLGNIAGDSIPKRNAILETGAHSVIVNKIQTSSNIARGHLGNMIWVLSNLCRGKPSPPSEVTSLIMKVIPNLLQYDDDSIISDCCWALSYTTDGDNCKIQEMIDLGILGKLISLLTHPDQNVLTPCLRTLGNVATGSEEQTQEILNHGIVDRLAPLLTSKKRGIKKEVLWTLSNIMAGSIEQVSTVVDHPCLRMIVDFMKDPDFEIKKEAVWAVSNATHSKSSRIIFKLVKEGAFDILSEVLRHQDPRILLVALEAINNVLKAGAEEMGPDKVNEMCVRFDENGGLTLMENLQSHPEQRIYDKVVKIMSEHYGVEEVDENVSENVVPTQFTFS